MIQTARAISSQYFVVRWPLQYIVEVLKFMIALIPSTEGVACDIRQQPSLSGIHAVLENLIAEHIIFILHYDVVSSIRDTSKIAFCIEFYFGKIKFISFGDYVFIVVHR